MRIYVCILLFCFSLSGQKRFQTDYFVQKHTLQLPNVNIEMLDVGELTHVSNSWEYFYKKNSTKLDSVVDYLTIEGFDASRNLDVYTYKGDSVIVRAISVAITDGDTLSNSILTYKDNFRTKSALDLKRNCIYLSKFDERGIKLLDVRKCSDENEFSGQEFQNIQHKEYIECIERRNGEIDSNSIRRYYLTEFDTIVADYMVRKDKEPFIVRLNTYNKQNKREKSYGFGIYANINEVVEIGYYTYTKTGNLYRAYFFQIQSHDAKVKKFDLSNYTEYEYDNLGRKIKTTTRVKPDPKPQKKE